MEINNNGVTPVNRHINEIKNEKETAEKETSTTQENIQKSPVNPTYYAEYFGIKNSSNSVPATEEERLAYLKELKYEDGSPIFSEDDFVKPTKNDDESFWQIESLNEKKHYENCTNLYKNDNAFKTFCMLMSLKQPDGKPVLRKETLNSMLNISAISTEPVDFGFLGIKANLIVNNDTKEFLQTLLNTKKGDGTPLFSEFNEECLIIAMVKPPSLSTDEAIKILNDINLLTEKKYTEFDDEDKLELFCYKMAKNPNYDIEAHYEDILAIRNKGISNIFAIVFSDLTPKQKSVFEILSKYKKDDGSNYFSDETISESVLSGNTYDGMVKDIDMVISEKDKDGKPIYNGYSISRMLFQDEDKRNRFIRFVKTQDKDIQKKISLLTVNDSIFDNDETLKRAVTLVSLKNEKSEDYFSFGYGDKLIKNEEYFNTFIHFHNDFLKYNIPFFSAIEMAEKGDDVCKRTMDLLSLKDDEGKGFFSYYSAKDIAENEEIYNIVKILQQKKNDEGKFLFFDFDIRSIAEKLKNKPDDFIQEYYKFISKTDSKGNPYYQNVSLIKSAISLTTSQLKTIDEISNLKNKYNEKLFTNANDEFNTIYSLFQDKSIPEEEQKKKINEFISRIKIFSEIRHPNIPEARFFTDLELKELGNSELDINEIIKNTDQLLSFKDKNGHCLFNSSIVSVAAKDKDGTQKTVNLYNLKTENGERVFFNPSSIITLLKNDDKYNLAIKYAADFTKDFKFNTFMEDCFISVINKGEKEVQNAIAFKNELIKQGKVDKYTVSDFLTGTKFYEFYNKSKINQFSLSEKKSLLRKIISSNADLFRITDLIRADFPLIPKDKDEYCSLVQGLVKSIGIETNPLTDKQIREFNNNITELSEILKNPSVKPAEITQEFSTKQLLQAIEEKTKNLDKQSKTEVYDYFCFDIVNGKLKGYPANLFNGIKLAQIDDEQTKQVIEELRPIIKRYSEENPVTIKCENGADIATQEKLNKVFNEIISALPEFRTTIGRVQHKTHSYDVATHSINVLKEIVSDEQFETLSDSDKKIMILASLLHDITKAEGEVDKTHEKESAFDSFFITEKFNLTQDEKSKLYDLIANHEWFAYVNKPSIEPKDRKHNIEDMAFALKTANTFELAQIFTKADLKSVTSDKSFYNRFIDAFPENIKLVQEKIDYLKSTQPMLPLGILPKASSIKAGRGIYKNGNGNVIIKLNEINDFEAIGFPKGTNKNNFKIMVHGLDSADQLARFSSFSIIDSDALLSTSYVIKPQTEYRVFRPQGLIINTDTSNIHAGVNMDYGTGCGKNLENLKRNFLFDGFRANDRQYFSDLIKSKLSLNDEDYIKFVEKYSNKTLAEIKKDDPNIAKLLIETFDEIELGNRRNNRAYNEVLITRPEIQGVFLYDMEVPSRVGDPVDFIDKQKAEREKVDLQYLLDYAKENDLPVIVFGD